jgi:hypothetical protein
MEFVCDLLILEQTANFALVNIERLVFITEVESVYCVVRTESLYNRDKFRPSLVSITYSRTSNFETMIGNC